MGRSQSLIFNENKLKLGLFALNCSGGMAVTKVAERWDNSWDNNIALARMADVAGIEFLLPIALDRLWWGDRFLRERAGDDHLDDRATRADAADHSARDGPYRLHAPVRGRQAACDRRLAWARATGAERGRGVEQARI